MITAPEYYERAPDGEQWPGTLKGLLKAIEDTTWKSVLDDRQFTLLAIRDGHAEPFRTFQHGEEQKAA